MTQSEDKSTSRKQQSEQNKLAQQKLDTRYKNEENNPCFKEQELSFKCMNDTNFKENACKDFFENYKACKGFWNDLQRQRRSQGIYPALPPVEEREKIKAEYLKGNLA